MRILALDVGTSSVKAAVLEVSSTVAVGPIAHVPYATDHPTPEAAEIPADRLWSAITSASRQASNHTVGIAGIGLSCLTPGLILLDKADRPLLPIWTHLDRRSRASARQVWAAVGNEFLATVGNRPLPGGISAVSWRQQLLEHLTLIREVRSYLHVNSWIGLRMTGERAFDPANASFTGLYGTLTDQCWSEHWCSYFQVDPRWLPPVVCGRTSIGHLRSAVAAELGVPAGIPVKLGTADTTCAMLAAGIQPGDLMHVVGTTQVLAALTEKPHPSPKRLTRQFGVGDSFIHATHNPVGGAALDWLYHLCFLDQSESVFFSQTVPAALNCTSRVRLDPAFLGGDRLEIEAHRAAFRDLTLATSREDLLAALLQAMRQHHREALSHLGLGDHWKNVYLTGGGAEVIHRLLPEYADASVHFVEEASLRGVARLFDATDASSASNTF